MRELYNFEIESVSAGLTLAECQQEIKSAIVTLGNGLYTVGYSLFYVPFNYIAHGVYSGFFALRNGINNGTADIGNSAGNGINVGIATPNGMVGQ